MGILIPCMGCPFGAKDYLLVSGLGRLGDTEGDVAQISGNPTAVRRKMHALLRFRPTVIGLPGTLGRSPQKAALAIVIFILTILTKLPLQCTMQMGSRERNAEQTRLRSAFVEGTNQCRELADKSWTY